GLKPDEAIVLEDSPNGITAAQAAGIFCVAVPNSLTKRLPIGHADMEIESLAAVPLPELIEQVESVRVGLRR
ncbi:MAG TPA: haloacid dehalogenase, partial [Chloroflexota bacterium]|nr:haloacid dehalogenase [Chloroflexota bacterium]